MDKHKDNGILLATDNLLKFVAGVMDLSKPDNELLNNVYREISEATGIDTALELYRLFKGQQVTFPVRFLNPDCVKQRIVEEYDGTNLSQLATKYDYSEKTIRRIIKKTVEEN